jgi:tetratricopeptide (TPR) repeat protein/TolB-like protein
MFCAYCGVRLASDSSPCQACGRSSGTAVATATPISGVTTTPLSGVTDSPTILDAGSADTQLAGSDPGLTRASTPSTEGTAAIRSVGSLGVGAAFGSRYHIIRLLGMGGMGAVYQAWDDALGVAVALKIIRPEITADAASARDLEKRFKRELLLARQVTHKNVVRIHDLGEIDGIKYLTMPYIQGSDLSTILSKEGKLSIPRAIGIARQVASGLQAAHEAGVVHRDLKPANVMIDADDQAVIMDFGIARSVSGGGATMAGAVVGTLEYMAPEQAMAQAIDHRADIYALGLMLYDMVLGQRHKSRAESAVAELMARVQKPLPPARSIDPSIPEEVERIIDRCTQPDPSGRYATTELLVHDLELVDPATRRATTGPLSAPPITRPVEPVQAPAPAPAAKKRSILKLLAGAAVLIAMLGWGWMLRDKFAGGGTAGPAAADKPLALVVLPFRNATGDQAFDWIGLSLADMVSADVGQSERLQLVPSSEVAQLLRDLRVRPETEIDASMIKRVTEFSSAERVLSGRYVKTGDQIRIEAALHGGGLAPVALAATAAGENDLPKAAQELAAGVHKSLALAESDVQRLRASAFKPSSSSVQALRYYSEGMQLAGVGEHLEATRRFEASTNADPKFALAFSRLAYSLARSGRAADAETASSKAVALSSNLPAEERELIAGTHARIVSDLEKAIASYEQLVKARPNDASLRFELATVLEDAGQFDRARDEYATVLDLQPNSIPALYAAGRVQIQRGEPQRAVEYLVKGQGLAIGLESREATANIVQALGIAYLDLGKPADALLHFQQAHGIRKEINDRRGVAASLSQIAQALEKQGKMADAWAAYNESIAIREELGDKRGRGTVLISLGASYLDGGRYTDALNTFKSALQVQRELGDDNRQARVLQNIGHVHVALAEYEEARTNVDRALELREKLKVPNDIALSLVSLGDISTRLGEFDRAQRHYLRALELSRSGGQKRGIAVGSVGMATLLAEQGRYGAALEASTEALNIFAALKERTVGQANLLIVHGTALSLSGRLDEARAPLDEALTLARELNNQSLIAQALNGQGETALFRGQAAAARALFEQAAQAASRAGTRYPELVARVNVNRAAIAEGRATPAVVAELKKLVSEADARGLRPLSAEASLYAGAGLVGSRKPAEARTELRSAVSKAERIGARALLVLAHYHLGEAERAAGDAGAAATHLEAARTALAELRKEARSDTLLNRADLKVVQQAVGQ